MEKNNLKGQYLEAAKKLQKEFDCNGSMAIIVDRNGTIHIGCRNLTFEECINIANKIIKDATRTYGY